MGVGWLQIHPAFPSVTFSDSHKNWMPAQTQPQMSHHPVRMSEDPKVSLNPFCRIGVLQFDTLGSSDKGKTPQSKRTAHA